MEVVYKLWEGSWRDDAVVKDEATKEYTVAGRVRAINHKGYDNKIQFVSRNEY